MTLNTARDMMRKNRPRNGKDASLRRACADRRGPRRRPSPKTRPRRLWEAVRKLPDKQRDAVLLVYGEGLSHAAAAEAMAISESDGLLAHP